MKMIYDEYIYICVCMCVCVYICMYIFGIRIAICTIKYIVNRIRNQI